MSLYELYYTSDAPNGLLGYLKSSAEFTFNSYDELVSSPRLSFYKNICPEIKSFIDAKAENTFLLLGKFPLYLMNKDKFEKGSLVYDRFTRREFVIPLKRAEKQ